MKFRKRPIVIEAEQWCEPRDGDIPEVQFPVPAFEGETKTCEHCNEPIKDHGRIRTLEGEHIVCPGDWIITGIKGEKYPCKPDIFSKTYDVVKDEKTVNINIDMEIEGEGHRLTTHSMSMKVSHNTIESDAFHQGFTDWARRNIEYFFKVISPEGE